MTSLCCNATPKSRTTVINDHSLACSKCGQWLTHRLEGDKLIPVMPEGYFRVAEYHVKNALGELDDRKDFEYLDRGTMLVAMVFLQMALDQIKGEYSDLNV